MQVYALYNGSDKVCEVDVETVPWLPVKPRVPDAWLRIFVKTALSSYFGQSKRPARRSNRLATSLDSCR
jgi:hypothetical protein